MTLDPHHFQQWERHHQFALDMRIRSLMPLAWGFTALDVDREALANGQMSLRSCRGITQDGFLFDCPGNHDLPKTQGVKEHFAPNTDRVRVYLALPAEQTRGRNYQLPGSPENRLTRFTVQNITLTDDNTGATEREIGVSSPNLRIAFGNDSLDDYTALQVAEVVRAQDGTYSLSDRFIPPCLAIGTSQNLMRILRQVLELLVAKDPESGRPVPFDHNLQQMMESFSSLAVAALEAYVREQGLRQQIQQLRIEIDEAKRQQQVSEIVESDFFQNLQIRARALRQLSRSGPSAETHGPDTPTPAAV